MRCLVLLFCLSVASAADASLAPTNAQLGDALKGADYATAIGLLDKIDELYGPAAAADQKEALKQIAKAARSKDLRTRHAAFSALGELRVKGSSKYLRRWLSPPKKAKTSHVEAIRAAGRIADRSTLNTLQKQVKHKDIEVAVAATMALGGFAALKPGRRKTLAFDLIQRMEQLTNMSGGGRGRRMTEAQARADPVFAAEIERRERLGVAGVMALQQLTGETLRTLKGWKRWSKKWKNKNPWK